MPGHDHAKGKGPKQTVTAARRQKLGRLLVTSTLHVRGTLVVEGRVAIPGRAARVFKFKKVTRKTPAHRLNIVRLKLGARALKTINRALRRGLPLKAVITVTGIDRTGGRNPVQKTIRLLPPRGTVQAPRQRGATPKPEPKSRCSSATAEAAHC